MTRRPIVAAIRTRDEEPEPEGELRLDDFREALACWTSGVAVLAVRDDDDVVAMTVSAFTSLSLRPPLVLVCVDEQAALLPSLEDAGRFTVSFLAEDQRRLALSYADRFPFDQAISAAQADPVLPGALAALVCSVAEMHPGGDHRIVIGRVERAEIGRDAPPLVHHRREYRTLG
ncbi:flavin reductase family protein [Longimicrobium sp.]|uniref:flavin reductase family protein n=1 Tax=Longimicrobium sp. TaxID=2029185 RepID=UPI002B96C084|nr:flavin reductase family protein [Longimicrobium sp.]HSU15325.1 flavin reductase family protein [Longimicrobium sp.]